MAALLVAQLAESSRNSSTKPVQGESHNLTLGEANEQQIAPDRTNRLNGIPANRQGVQPDEYISIHYTNLMSPMLMSSDCRILLIRAQLQHFIAVPPGVRKSK